MGLLREGGQVGETHSGAASGLVRLHRIAVTMCP